MNRRGFLAALLGGAVLDPERLLWTPGKKLISIPKPAPVWVHESEFFHLGDICTVQGFPGRLMVTQVGQSLSDVRFTPIGLVPIIHSVVRVAS